MGSPPPVSRLFPWPGGSSLGQARSGLIPATGFILLALASPAVAAEVRLDVAGQVRAAEGRLIVRVDLVNRGDTAATTLQVEGDLVGARSQAVLSEPLVAGATRAVDLVFPREVPRPGVHALALHLRYAPEGSPAGAEPASQRAYLLLALGANPPPSVRLSIADVRVARYTAAPVRLESADGEAHRVRLRALTPRGINAVEPEKPVAVPAAGTITVPLGLLRAGAPAHSQAGVVVLAAEVDGPLERTAAGVGRVEVVAPPAPWLPRLRAPLLAAALALLGAAVVSELSRVRSRRA
jgi:hypothetical protein